MEFLFERLSALPRASADTRLRQAVLAQLEWLVGSREWLAEGTGRALIDIAMPEPPNLAACGSEIDAYARRLRRLIELHEPRLSRLELTLVPTGRAMTPFRIVISGQLAPGGPDGLLHFERLLGSR